MNEFVCGDKEEPATLPQISILIDDNAAHKNLSLVPLCKQRESVCFTKIGAEIHYLEFDVKNYAHTRVSLPELIIPRFFHGGLKADFFDYPEFFDNPEDKDIVHMATSVQLDPKGREYTDLTIAIKDTNKPEYMRKLLLHVNRTLLSSPPARCVSTGL